MNSQKEIKWAVIGAGNVCEIKSAPAMSALRGSQIKTVMRRNAEKAADYAQRHNIPNWTTDANDILNDPEITAIYIATPPDTHASYTALAAKAGKAVYVEKPMANTYAECLSMIEVCKKHQVPLFVAYYRRTLPGFLKVKEIIESNVLGAIRCVSIEMFQPMQPALIAQAETNWRVKPEIAGGGYFHDLASHQLDYLDFVFGSVVEAKGISGNQAGQYPADDIVTASFKFESGVIGSGIWCFTTDQNTEKDEIKIVGSKGQLSFNTFGDPMIIKIKTGESEQELRYSHKQPIQTPLIQMIIDHLNGNGTCVSTGETAAKTTLIMEQIVGRK